MSEQQPQVKRGRWHRIKLDFTEAFSSGFRQPRGTVEQAQLSGAAERRRHAYRYILNALAAVITPISLLQFYQGHHLPAAVGFILLGIVFANIWRIGRNREALFSPTLVLAMTLIVILVSIYHGQTYTHYWMYPLLALMPLILRFRSALWLGAACGVLLLPALYLSFDGVTAVVICLSMAVTWFVSAWLIYAVTAQSRRLRNMAYTDPLTGAYNRRYFQLQVQVAFDQWQRNKRPASILLMDVDFFKRINDKWGHAVGDLVLQGLVELITSRVRKIDVVCRYGGEEFAILLPETSAAGALHVAQEIRSMVEQASLVESDSVTISIGLCEVIGVQDTDHWVNLTDAALYLAKKKGRNRVELSVTKTVPEAVPSLDRTVPQWR
jgi:diguanylate cyclase (GGDEF)-like protein